MILGIDQSFTKTAICLFNYAGELIDFTVIKTKGGKDTFWEKRMIGIVEELEIFIKKNEVSIVVLEGLSSGRNTVMSRPLAGLFYYICANLYKNGITYHAVSPKEVKKLAIKGDAKKEEMVESLPEDIKNRFLERYSKSTGLTDLADAYFIGKSFFKIV